ncbi:MAG: type 1 glutamine amidotransferase domain-containing protein [Planctomycetota bacterium]
MGDVPSILVVLTSHDRLGDTGDPTGFWLEELAAPYFVFRDAGARIVLASPKGGLPPIDPKSQLDEFQTDSTRRFIDDAAAMEQLRSTQLLDGVDEAGFDAVFFPGGHGPLWDLVENADAIRLVERFWAARKAVGAVCHAPIVFRGAKDAEGNPIVKDKQVTGFSNSEEAAVGLAEVVPLLVEDELVQLGGRYERAADFVPFVLRDGLLVTGQNPASSAPAAELLLESLG